MFDRTLVASCAFVVMAACAAPQRPALPAASGAIVDLSHDYGEQTIFWPTAESFKLEKVADGETPQGYYYAANSFATAEHGGTHLDAPLHFARGLGASTRFRSIG